MCRPLTCTTSGCPPRAPSPTRSPASVEVAGPKQTELKGKDFKTDQEVRWCPGCGDYVILNAVQSFLPSLGIAREDMVIVSGIGCSSRFPYYMNTYGMHSIHGRAPAIATGLAASRPDLSVWVVTGDGDALSHRRQPPDPRAAPQREPDDPAVQQPDLRADQGPVLAHLRGREGHQVHPDGLASTPRSTPSRWPWARTPRSSAGRWTPTARASPTCCARPPSTRAPRWWRSTRTATSSTTAPSTCSRTRPPAPSGRSRSSTASRWSSAPTAPPAWCRTASAGCGSPRPTRSTPTEIVVHDAHRENPAYAFALSRLSSQDLRYTPDGRLPVDPEAHLRRDDGRPARRRPHRARPPTSTPSSSATTPGRSRLTGVTRSSRSSSPPLSVVTYRAPSVPCWTAADPAVAALELRQPELLLQDAVVVQPQREDALPLEDADQQQAVVGAPLLAVEERARRWWRSSASPEDHTAGTAPGDLRVGHRHALVVAAVAAVGVPAVVARPPAAGSPRRRGRARARRRRPARCPGRTARPCTLRCPRSRPPPPRWPGRPAAPCRRSEPRVLRVAARRRCRPCRSAAPRRASKRSRQPPCRPEPLVDRDAADQRVGDAGRPTLQSSSTVQPTTAIEAARRPRRPGSCRSAGCRRTPGRAPAP